MKTFFKYKVWVLSAFVLFSLLSCNEDLVEINENKNKPTFVPVDEFLEPLQLALSTEYSEHSYRAVSKMMNYTEQPTRLWDEYMEGEEDDFWLEYFNQLRNIKYIVNNASPSEIHHKAIALIIKSWSTYVTTSLYGDIPYSEAGKADEGVNLPAYDSQEDIFKDIISNLEKANNLLAKAAVAINKDRLLEANPLFWRKFANSLKVRVLIARSKKVNPAAELQKMLSNSDAYPLIESNQEQPTFTYNDTNTYPNGSGYHSDNTFVGEDFINTLINLSDKRISAFASPTVNATPNNYAGLAVGTRSIPDIRDNFSLVSPLIFESNKVHALQTVWMSYAELNFLLAEAAEKSWISGGTELAKTYYEKGIKASYEYQQSRVDFAKKQGVDITAIPQWSAAYLTTDGVSYKGSSNEKLNFIAKQKWIALFNDLESYLSWKRTGLPKLSSNPKGPDNGVIPLRYKYPNDELNFNSDNVKKAIANQGEDKRSTLMWILK